MQSSIPADIINKVDLMIVLNVKEKGVESILRELEPEKGMVLGYLIHAA